MADELGPCADININPPKEPEKLNTIKAIKTSPICLTDE
jgi:hypothetical protein